MSESQVETDPHGATMASGGGTGTPPAGGLRPVDPGLYGERVILSEGGMGRITVALDRRLGRRVALKELRRATPALDARFEREALLTARLEHPAIVSVHEAGRWPGGEPFYAMRLVPGRPLDAALRQATTLEARLALVPRVLAVADAIAYAHRQRIIHRDLKPHNVMLGEFGETVVIDWGLGKDLDDGRAESYPERPAADGETAYGSVLGTPAYMPPEQARGEPVDERADVYAIGAMLRHVLTGEAPYGGRTSQEIVAAVLAGPPPPLAARAPGVPADLVAIVERAMARAPADRYPTGKELADDLRRFQTGQLVGAHRYSTRERLFRWVRRHRAAVAVAAVALVVLAAASGFALDRVLEERRVAETQRALAVEHRGEAETLVGFMLEDLYKQLATVERLDLLEPVVREVIAYHARAAARGAPPDARAGKARSHLGDILFGKGDVDAALVEYRAAQDLFAAAPGADPKLRRDRAVLHNRIGDMIAAKGTLDDALAEYRRALAGFEALVADEPAERRWQLDVAFTRRRIGGVLELQGDRDGALAEYRAAQTITGPLAAADPEDIDTRSSVGVGHNKIADVLVASGDFPAAIAELTEARRIAEEVFAIEPTAARQRDIAVALQKLGTARLLAREEAAALADYRAMLAITERIAARDPANAMWRRDLAIGHAMVGDALRDTGDRAGAMPHYRTSLEVREALASTDPDNPTWQGDLALIHDRIAKIDEAEGRLADALDHLRASQAIRLRFVAAHPENTDWIRNTGIGHFKIAHVLRAQGDLDGAIAEARQAAARHDALVAIDGGNALWLNGQTLSHNLLASLLLKSGDLDGGAAASRADVAAARRLAARAPDHAVWQTGLAESLEESAKILDRLGDAAGASAARGEAAAIRARVPETK